MAVGAKVPNTYTDTTITTMITSAPFSGDRRELKVIQEKVV